MQKCSQDLQDQCQREKIHKWFDITEKVENATKKYMLENKNQGIYPNVDLYSAPLYYSMGFPIDLNTPIFAIARIAGWASHVIEEKFAQAPLNQPFIVQRQST